MYTIQTNDYLSIVQTGLYPQMSNISKVLIVGAGMAGLVAAYDYSANSVTVHYKTPAGSSQIQADFAIIAIPFSVLRFVDVIRPFSAGKQMAIRQVHYGNAAKVFVQCRRRFWANDEAIFGGITVTDLPNRGICYPDHGRETGQGVLMTTFCYGEEANRWAALSSEERIRQSAKHAAKVHPQILEEFETGFSKVWSDDKFAGGALALFEPGQEARLQAHIVAPEGPVHFAGEHASSKHCWIEGAVESGIRAAQEVHIQALASHSY